MEHPLETLVLRIWKGAFPSHTVDLGSNFFSLGGDSLAAMEMVLEVERQSGRPVPIGQLYLTPVLQEFAAALVTLQPNENAPLYIPLKDGTDAIPLFGIAPAMGGVFHFRELAAALPDHRALHIIEPRFSVSGKHAYKSITDIADSCVRVIRNKQPQGPYRMAGYSFGGILAWAIARRLEQSGEKVDLLVFLDSSCRNGYTGGSLSTGFWNRTRAHWEFLRECLRIRRQFGQPVHLRRCFPLILHKVSDSLSSRPAKFSSGIPVASKGAWAMQIPAQEQLRRDYDPGHYSGHAHLFRSKRQLTLHRELDYDLGWSSHLPAGHLHVTTVPGDHFSLVRQPQVADLCKCIEDLTVMADAQLRSQVDKEVQAAATLKPLAFPEPVHGECLTGRFHEVARQYPHHPALRDGGACLSYKQLREVAIRIAAFLMEKDPNGREPVLLHFASSWQFVCSLYGVLLAGRCYLPIEPQLPDQRIQEIISTAGARMAISLTPEKLHGEGFADLQVFSFEDVSSHPPAEAVLPASIEVDAPAVLLFTSGSTGHPKGTYLSRKMLLHVCWRRSSSCGFSPQDRYALLYVSAFMGGVIAIHTPLLMGATLCIYDLRKRGLPGLRDWMENERITILHLITSILRRFMQSWQGQPPLPDLRLLIPGGERTRASDFALFKACCTDKVRFCACLGSTECGTIAMNPLQRDFDYKDGPMPLGVPYRALNLRILREDGSEAACGEEGQMVVESDYIFRGYTGADSLTASVVSFSPDGKAIYRTGDFGFLSEDGILFNLGRKDSRVKIKGNLVELAEVESAIMGSGLVEEVAVIHRSVGPDEDEKQLVAFFKAAAPKSSNPEADINRHLLSLLPFSMIPSHWVQLAEFPQTQNGKTNRRSLETLPLGNGNSGR